MINYFKDYFPPVLFFFFVVFFFTVNLSCSKPEDLCSKSTWYEDADGDGFGNPSISVLECDKPAGFVADNSDPDDTKPAGLDQEISVSIMSINIGESYPIKILLPKEYETDKNLPVIYLLDGLRVYNGRTFFQDLVTYTNSITGLNAILVAVGDKLGAERERDFLASGCGGGNEEGFGNFYKFINEEVVSYIDENYENDHTVRTLIGFSHAGNFTNNVLFREDAANIIFHNFISVDPSNCTLSHFQEQIDKMDFPVDTNIKIHLSQAEFTAAGILNGLFDEKNFPFLKVDYNDYENEDHNSVVAPSIRRGLKFVYGL